MWKHARRDLYRAFKEIWYGITGERLHHYEQRLRRLPRSTKVFLNVTLLAHEEKTHVSQIRLLFGFIVIIFVALLLYSC